MSEQGEDQEQTSAPLSNQDGGDVSGEVELDQPDGSDGQAGGVLETLRQPRVVAGIAGGILSLATSGGAILWLQRRRTGGFSPSANGAVPRRRGPWTRFRVGRRAPSRPPTMQDRMVTLASQGREQARRVGTEVASRAGQLRPAPEPTGWQTAGTRLQGAQQRVGTNRFTLAAIVVAVSLLGAARWLDQQQTTRRGR